MEPAAPASPDETDPDRERAERHARNLKELGEIGMRIARNLDRQVAGEIPTPPDAPDPSLQFGRIAKAVRMTAALEAKLARQNKTDIKKSQLVRRWRDVIADLPPPTKEPDKARRVLERLIESEADPDEIAELMRDLREKLAKPEAPGEGGASAETIEMIKRRILGIKRPLDEGSGSNPGSRPGAASAWSTPAGPDPP